jgi:anti-sigma regulatory factor (Ser/Thr protein kinase)/CheY-like chemotaxis protein
MLYDPSIAMPLSVLLIGATSQAERWLRADPSLADARVDHAQGSAHALRLLRRHSYEVVVTDRATAVDEDLALLEEMREIRPLVKVVLLTPEAAPEELIRALRAHVFAVFDAPFDPPAVVEMIRLAIEECLGREGIEVLAATRDWVSLRLDCRRLTAERVLGFLNQLRERDLSDPERADLMLAVREVLMNAIEHGGALDPDQVVELSAVRTARAIVFYIRDPGPGFRMENLPHAAISNPPDDPTAHFEHRLRAGLRPGGFGLLLARSIVDEMIVGERGNEILLVKHTA